MSSLLCPLKGLTSGHYRNSSTTSMAHAHHRTFHLGSGTLWQLWHRCVTVTASLQRRVVHHLAGPKTVFGRLYYRSCLWHDASSLVCRLSVCDVLYCGKTVRPSEKLSVEVDRKPGSKS